MLGTIPPFIQLKKNLLCRIFLRHWINIILHMATESLLMSKQDLWAFWFCHCHTLLWKSMALFYNLFFVWEWFSWKEIKLRTVKLSTLGKCCGTASSSSTLGEITLYTGGQTRMLGTLTLGKTGTRSSALNSAEQILTPPPPLVNPGWDIFNQMKQIWVRNCAGVDLECN